jgi:hypothetical protein
MRFLPILAALFLATTADAATITAGIGGGLSQTRGFERSGPYSSDWKSIPDVANLAAHQGRDADVFEDAGRGQITFKVKADANGRARVAFQDVGDTGNFHSFSINGQKVELPSQQRDGGWFTAELDFGVGGLGWHQVVARTTLQSGLSRSPQDGIGACRTRAK